MQYHYLEMILFFPLLVSECMWSLVYAYQYCKCIYSAYTRDTKAPSLQMVTPPFEGEKPRNETSQCMTSEHIRQDSCVMY